MVEQNQNKNKSKKILQTDSPKRQWHDVETWLSLTVLSMPDAFIDMYFIFIISEAEKQRHLDCSTEELYEGLSVV